MDKWKLYITGRDPPHGERGKSVVSLEKGGHGWKREGIQEVASPGGNNLESKMEGKMLANPRLKHALFLGGVE